MDIKTEEFLKNVKSQNQYDSTNQDQSQLSCIFSLNFLLQGVISLTCWNSILSSLDYFNITYPSYNAPFYLPIPYVVAINVTSFLMPWLSTRMGYNPRVYGSIIGMALLQVLFILTAQEFKIDSETGFAILICMIFIAGMCGQILTSTQIGMASQINFRCLVLFNTGNSFSGVISILIRIVCLFIFGDPDSSTSSSLTNNYQDYSQLQTLQQQQFLQQQFFNNQSDLNSFYGGVDYKQQLQNDSINISRNLSDFYLLTDNSDSQALKNSTFLYFVCGSIVCLLGLFTHYFMQRSTQFQDLFKKKAIASFVSLEFEKQSLYEIEQPLIKPKNSKTNCNSNQQQQGTQNQNNKTLQIKNIDQKNKPNNTDINSDLDFGNNNNNNLKNSEAESEENSGINNNNNQQKIKLLQIIKQMIQMYQLIQHLPIFMIFLNLTSMMMFPGVILKAPVHGLSPTWSTICIIATYNVTNSLAKYLAKYRILYSKKCIYIIIMARLLLFAVFIVNATCNTFLRDTEFIIITLAIFSSIDGLSNGALFVLATEEVFEKEEKEMAGFLMAQALSIGIMLGSFLALPFQNI